MRRPQQAAAPRAQKERSTYQPRGFLRVLLRLDVCWSLFFGLFLVCVALITTSITQTQISSALLENLHSVHFLHISTLQKKIEQGTMRAFRMAAGFVSLHSKISIETQSERTLVPLCSILTTYDVTRNYRSLAFTSLETKDAVVCIHDDVSSTTPGRLYGWMSVNSVIPGVYLINNRTYEFQQPLTSHYGGWPSSMYNITDALNSMYEEHDVFKDAEAYYNGSLTKVDMRKYWWSFSELPHMLYCSIPVGFLFRGLPLPAGVGVADYVDVRLSIANFLVTTTFNTVTNITAAFFVNASLTDDDPLIMSNNWGQASVNDSEIIIPSADHKVSYLKVSEVTSHLMQAALRHVTLKNLQRPGYDYTKDFQYKGAPATVTAQALTLATGLKLHAVFVTSHAKMAMPYRRIMDISNGATAVAILLCTAWLYFFIHYRLRNPLHHITNLLLLSVRRGARKLFRLDDHAFLALTEVQQLGEAHNAAMRRLRQVDAFIPAELQSRHSKPHLSTATVANFEASVFNKSVSVHHIPASKALMRHLSTVVNITIRPCNTAPAPQEQQQQQQSQRPYAGQRLAAVVAHAARAAELVNSGPFPTPAALEAFVAALHRCCDDCDGTVLRLTPDSCVLHFGRAARTHLTTTATTTAAAGGTAGGDADTDACAARDARSALRFAFALLRWVDRCDAARMPDVRVLVDTGVFTCGQYRPRGSEQTMFVALGRDVQRKLGHVPAAIGVRVAMTEETARCVRAGAGTGADAACGVRQLPVEAFHVGRPGLNADVVILFEALPGRAEDEAWRLYARHCARAFSALVRGDYAGALRHYREVAWIADLEPGLVPHSLRREAARSSAVAGAASTQVERLMRECVQRVVRGRTQPFLRERHVPLGIDAVLGASTPAGAVPETVASTAAAPQLQRTQSGRHGSQRQRAMLPRGPAAQRHVVEMRDGGATVRAVVASPLEWVLDNYGLQWHVASQPVRYTPEDFWKSRLPCLGSAGALAVTNFLAYREVPPVVANAIRDAPLGPMSDALRSAVPVFGVTSRQKAALHTLYRKQRQLQHPNLLIPLGYTTAPEGGVAFIWEHTAGGTLREVVARYDRLKPLILCRYMHGVLSALSFLHRHGVVHSAMSLDNVMVGADGVCRLRGHVADREGTLQLVVIPRTCYVSPRMAAGEAPTPECDMFCYGLMCLELPMKNKAWQWATAVQENASERTEEELSALMSGPKQLFYAAVVSGEVVPNLTALDTLAPANEAEVHTCAMLRACLSYDPAERPTAETLRRLSFAYLTEKGLRIFDDFGY